MLDPMGDNDLKEAERQIYKDSLYHTAKFLLGMSDINWHTHGEMIEALEELEFREKGISNALIIMPRGSLKSSVGSTAFPIWRLLRDPNKRILIDSATYDLSTQLVSAVAQHLESERVTSLFGTFRTKDDWSSKSLTISQRTKIYKESSIVASGVGSPKTGAHFDCIIHDDLNNEKNSATPELMEKVVRHYQMNYAILDPGGDSCVIATRYAALDVPGHILTNELGIDHLPDYLKAT
jgi:hypothetical protein